jgi:hypothetical protein
VRLKEVHVYKNACATWSNTLLAGWINFSPLVNQPVVLLVQLNVREMEEGKIATAWAQFGAMKEVHQCIRMRATLSNTLLAWGRLGSISALW